jgi:hypothetical protein
MEPYFDAAVFARSRAPAPARSEAVHSDRRAVRNIDAGPVLLFHDLVGAADLEPAIAALRQFHRLCRTGEFLSESGPTLQQSRRLILALRTYDALAQGASIRDIGSMIHCDERVRADWPGSGDALKSQARRLIALAHHMVSGGYRRLLR